MLPLKKNFKNQILIFIAVFFQFSCHEENTQTSWSASEEFSENDYNLKDQYLLNLKHIINTNEIKKWVTVQTPNYKKRLEEKINKRILIIDSGMYLTSLTLFKDRVIGQFRTEGSKILKDNYQLTIPQIYHDFAALQAKNMQFYQDDDTQEILSKFFEKIPTFEWARTAHGDSIFNYIATNTSDLDLMILRLDDWECYPKNIKQLNDYREMMDARAIALREFFESYQVDYINFSGGWSIPDFKQTYKNGAHPKCGSIPNEDILLKIDLVWKKFYDDVFSSGDAIMFQASPQLVKDFAGDASSIYISDCSKQQNRIRVQSLASPLISQYFEELDIYHRLGDSFLSCSDLLVNTPDTVLGDIPKQLKLSPFGLTLYPMGWPSSYTTPMALVAWLKRSNKDDNEMDMLTSIRNGQAFMVDIRAKLPSD